MRAVPRRMNSAIPMDVLPTSPTVSSFGPPPSGPSEEGLARVRLLATDANASLDDGGPLCAAVVDVATRARASGCPPERTLVALKLCAPPHSGYATPERARWLRTAIVRWTIESYFDAK